MLELVVLLTAMLAVSLILNLYQISYIRTFKRRLRDNPNLETQTILATILSGDGLFRITQIPEENVLLRRR